MACSLAAQHFISRGTGGREMEGAEGRREALNPSQENKNKLAGPSSLVLDPPPAPPPSHKIVYALF